MSQGCGVFGQPAATAAFAGVEAAARGLIGPEDRVVAIYTGTGLKDPQGRAGGGGTRRHLAAAGAAGR